MRITNILARFLSLMDIALLLLGLFIVLLVSARYSENGDRSQKNMSGEKGTAIREFIKNNLGPIYLYACCEGEHKNHCQLMDEEFVPGREIDIESDRDIKQLIEEQKPLNPIIFLITQPGDFDYFWDEKQKDIEDKWNHSIIRIRNAKF